MARTYKNLLVPLSLVEPSDAVLRYARHFADANQGKITLLHVVPTQSYRLLSDVYRSEESGGANQDFAEQVARERLEKIRHDYYKGVDCDVVVRAGSNAAKVVLAAESELESDIVLISKSGASEVGARLQGGLVEKLIRSSSCAVLSASAQGEVTGNYMAPVDFDAKSVTIARLAGNFATTMGGKVTLLHVVIVDSVALEMNHEVYGHSGDGPVNLLRAQANAKARLDAFARSELGAVPHDTKVVIGRDLASSILEVEGADRPFMILMATAGYTGFFQFVLGSAAETVARRAACSVITVKLK